MQCPHCFREAEPTGPCPFCGYEGTSQEKKYPLALRPGTILNGRYTLGHVLGQGGFGITYIAQDYQTGERVAIKEYLPTDFAGRSGNGLSVQVYSDERAQNFAFGKDRFLEEAKTLAAFIGTTNIVRIHSYFEENETAYLCMEYVDGLPLDKYVAAHGGRLNTEEASRLLLPLMESLEAVHARGIVHRDIAPDNILIMRDGTVKLIDFGAARYSTGEKTKSLDIVLKHGFAPYEQYLRRGRQGPWTDVYALAATFYYSITGKVPPDAPERMQEELLIPPSTLGVKLTGTQEAALLRGLEINASNRFQSMGEFHRAMLEASSSAVSASTQKPVVRPVSGSAPKPVVQTVPEPAPKPVRKKSKLPLFIGAAAVFLIAVLVIILGGRKDASPVPAAAAAPMAMATAPAAPDAANAPSATVVSNAGNLRFVTGGDLGTYYRFSGAIAGVLNERLQGTLNIHAEPSRGSLDNLQQIDSGEADIGFTQSDIMAYVYTGTNIWEDRDPITSYAAVVSCYPEYVHILAGKDITSIEQLRGKRVCVGPAGNNTDVIAGHILAAYGIGYEDVVIDYRSFSESADALKNGTVDAAFVVAHYPVTSVTELAAFFDLNLLPIDEAHAASLLSDHGFYSYGMIPGGTYRPVEQDTPAVAVMAVIVASRSVPDDVIYAFLSGLFDYREQIAADNARGAELDLNTAISGVVIPWHPGAERYYREHGLDLSA